MLRVHRVGTADDSDARVDVKRVLVMAPGKSRDSCNTPLLHFFLFWLQIYYDVSARSTNVK